ncbi:nucleotidyltransferase domain-containing protein [Candidatus Woesearchaeota archaeon]|nr:nucleotidyltransferase domain-containing protein [Candidatus Woesearchaeota archaeon]
MYLSTLSQTAENILVFLLNNLGEEYSIREIAKAVGQDYKIVFTTVQHLRTERLVDVKRVSNINRCCAYLSKENAAIFAYVSERQAVKALPKRIFNALREVVQGIANPFYALFVFGSYAKGTAKQTSDVDILIISHDKDQYAEFRSAIKKSATLNNLTLNPVILTLREFQAGLKEPSVSKEAYEKHLVIYGGESFYNLISP